MLLRNLDPSQGLANGTRLVVETCHPKVIEAKIVGGKHHGKHVFLPRIKLITSDDDQVPCVFSRHQFPLRLAFAMTINKSQGQTLKKAVIFLPSPVFSHGQLYVAMSRCGQPGGVRFMVTHASYIGEEPGYNTYNAVYTEAFA